jgi:hypothetical protein
MHLTGTCCFVLFDDVRHGVCCLSCGFLVLHSGLGLWCALIAKRLLHTVYQPWLLLQGSPVATMRRPT